ncbi:hypothetical protein ACSX1A_06145 [Pontibacter sp. MBLB2868]|uniref:hypothetical protein n=1 Tax=Pontibacter sp. MBLB2868 TaxID=3451555 RepID=UPI003F74EF3C
MKSKHNIALHFLLLLWAGLLCFSGYTKAQQVCLKADARAPDTATEQLKAEKLAFPVAWSETSATHRTLTPTDPVLPPLVQVQWPQPHITCQLNKKTCKAILGSSSITEKFRILPNAP